MFRQCRNDIRPGQFTCNSTTSTTASCCRSHRQATHPCHHRPIGSACERHPNPAVQAPSHPCAGLLAQLRPASVQSVTWGWIFYTHQWSFQLTKYACWGIRSCQVFPWPGRRFGSYKKLIVADLQQQRLLQGTPREIKRACLSTCLRDKLLFDLPVSLSDSCTGS